MPTLPDIDPTKLPGYPDSPHRTGQARVFVDRRSQYLGKFGTNESYALYHLLCLRKLVDGTSPSTRELRLRLQDILAGDDRVSRVPSGLWLQVAVLFGTTMLVGTVVFYATRNSTNAAATVNRPNVDQAPSLLPGSAKTAIGPFSHESSNTGRVSHSNARFAAVKDRTDTYAREIQRRILQRRGEGAAHSSDESRTDH